MIDKSAQNKRTSWRNSPWGLVVLIALTLLVLQTLLRVVLLARFGASEATATDIARIFSIGLVSDLFVILAACLPMILWFTFVPHKFLRSTAHKFIWRFWMIGFWTFTVFALIAEFFFFEEFRSRFNTVAVDYLLFPHEVFINIWDTYPVAWVLLAAILFGVFWLILSRRMAPDAFQFRPSFPKRLAILASVIAVVALLWTVIGNHLTRFSPNRTLNELANNGWYTFFQAAVTREFEYTPFYKTMDLDAAYKRVRNLVSLPNSEFVDKDPHSLTRIVQGDASKPKMNVVVLLEESLGSEFFGCLGRTEPTCTPELDKLSHEALLFTNLYASGNRTVRGMEAVLCSFPPLPGDSVVVRSRGKPIETLARVMKRDGYNTTFIYAGRGVFDRVGSFMSSNGYDNFIEQKDFQNPQFSTIWGVCNEDLYNRGIEECRKADQAGKPFFLTMLSVSNHKPFTYPKGRIPENPDDRTRENAVKYTDFSIGQFIQNAKKERFWTNTIFVVVADHGARVYGHQTIPMKSYEIPCFVFGPSSVVKPQRVGIPGGQVDVAPTLLGLIGRPYFSTFFGRDLFKIDPATGRSLLNHNRDIGLYENSQMVVLGLNKTVEYFEGNPKLVDPQKTKENTNRYESTEMDAVALFQVANDLYSSNAYHIDENISMPLPPSSTFTLHQQQSSPAKK